MSKGVVNGKDHFNPNPDTDPPRIHSELRTLHRVFSSHLYKPRYLADYKYPLVMFLPIFQELRSKEVAGNYAMLALSLLRGYAPSRGRAPLAGQFTPAVVMTADRTALEKDVRRLVWLCKMVHELPARC